MKVIIEGDPKEIAALVVAVQERQEKTFVISSKVTIERSASSSGDVRKGVISSGTVR